MTPDAIFQVIYLALTGGAAVYLAFVVARLLRQHRGDVQTSKEWDA